MACPTCDHALSPIGNGLFHCQRCGTLKWTIDRGERFEAAVPMLVDRCREFANETVSRYLSRDANNALAELRSAWLKLGIAESINLPENRPGS